MPVRSSFVLPLVLGALAGAGCGSGDNPAAPDPIAESGFMLVEGDGDWDTNSVSWEDSASGLGRFAFISVARGASTNGPSHFLYSANFTTRCNNEDCFPQAQQLFVEPGLTISDVSWSPRGALVAFQGNQAREATWIYTLPTLAPGGTPRRWVTGFEPVFTPDAGLVVYVESGRNGIRSLNPSSGGGFTERTGMEGAAHPAVSPDGDFIAYSALDGARGRRIFVHDRSDPTLLADIVSHPDRLPGGQGGDGTDDDFPVWSPGGRYLAYRTKVRENTIRSAIFVTNPHQEPENPYRLVAIEAGREMTGLRWHRGGEYLLVVIDGDVYAYPMPEPYRSY
jgi:Tol biopolymer transport system component